MCNCFVEMAKLYAETQSQNIEMEKELNELRKWKNKIQAILISQLDERTTLMAKMPESKEPRTNGDSNWFFDNLDHDLYDEALGAELVEKMVKGGEERF